MEISSNGRAHRRTEEAVTWKCGARVEHVVDDDTMEVKVWVESGY